MARQRVNMKPCPFFSRHVEIGMLFWGLENFLLCLIHAVPQSFLPEVDFKRIDPSDIPKSEAPDLNLWENIFPL
jgi:hypothetical protein